MTHNQLQLQANKIEQNKAFEVARHNVRQEQLSDWLNRETGRHNVAVEVETNRHQSAMEGLESSKNSILNYQAVEQTRHNLAIEHIQRWSTQVEADKAAEVARHNRESEQINAWMASNDALKNAETALHNRNTESLTSRQIVTDTLYKSASAQNQISQAFYNRSKTKTENAVRTPKTVQEWENVIINPIEAGSRIFSNIAKGASYGLRALNAVK